MTAMPGRRYIDTSRKRTAITNIKLLLCHYINAQGINQWLFLSKISIQTCNSLDKAKQLRCVGSLGLEDGLQMKFQSWPKQHNKNSRTDTNLQTILEPRVAETKRSRNQDSFGSGHSKSQIIQQASVAFLNLRHEQRLEISWMVSVYEFLNYMW